jgi:hypothetical protein
LNPEVLVEADRNDLLFRAAFLGLDHDHGPSQVKLERDFEKNGFRDIGGEPNPGPDEKALVQRKLSAPRVESRDLRVLLEFLAERVSAFRDRRQRNFEDAVLVGGYS